MTPPFSIRDKVLEKVAAGRKVYPCHTNRASELGHPCTRYLYFARTAWQEKALPSPELQMIFDAGRELEDYALRRIQEAGIRVTEQQRPFEWKDLQITGTVDGMMAGVPLEIKHLNQFTFAKVNTIQDMTAAPQIWLRKYPVQLGLYMLLAKSEQGVLLLVNKQSFDLKEIWFNLDDILDLVETALKRAETVNKAILDKTLPDPMPFEEECLECPFFVKCRPLQERGEGFQLDDSPELILALARYGETEAQIESSGIPDLQTEAKKLKDKIRAMTEGADTVLSGNFVITGKWQEKKGYEVKPSKSWQIKIQKLPAPK
jgi:hypothetical protein